MPNADAKTRCMRRCILITVLREAARRGVRFRVGRGEKEESYVLLRVNGERFVASADFISHVKLNNRRPHGLLPATACPHGLRSGAHQTHKIASEMYVYNFVVNLQTSEQKVRTM